jgi:hypothetical protein
VETNRERRPTIAWQDVAQATALHAAGMPWREICLRTGLTEWQWKRVRQLFNATVKEAKLSLRHRPEP